MSAWLYVRHDEGTDIMLLILFGGPLLFESVAWHTLVELMIFFCYRFSSVVWHPDSSVGSVLGFDSD